MRIQAPHCPSCGAPLEVPEGVARVTCTWCSVSLIIEANDRVSTHRPLPPRATPDDEAPYPEPDATLQARVYPRFELSLIEQKIPDTVPELFAELELPEERFAFVSMRVVDREGHPVAFELRAAFARLQQSLNEDADPGLAANVALETLCERPFDHRLECAIALFEPRHMRVLHYAAGHSPGLLWASSEEGRTMHLSGHGSPLERKNLRETSDHFSNGRPVFLAAGDLILLPSAGFTGRGGRNGSDGVRVLTEVANAQLGEAPLRVVTLAKNEFWKEFNRSRRSGAPVGDVRVAAVRAVAPAPVDALPASLTVKTLRSRRYEVSLLTRADDTLELLPLRDDRQVVLWLHAPAGPLPRATVEAFRAALLAVLDGDTGDNENPRRAGREALEAAGLTGETVRAAVIQLFDQYERVKYWRLGWKQPLSLNPRGVRGDSIQQFDEGGEATVNEGGRLFFPGELLYEGQHLDAARFATVWRGGKASRLYEALLAHWKTRKTERAVQQAALAALSDEPTASVGGLALVSCLPPP